MTAKLIKFNPVTSERKAIDHAGRYMRECRAPLIDQAIREGWSKSLKRMIAGRIGDHYRVNRSLPSLEALEAITIPADVVRQCQGHGQALDTGEMLAVLTARHAMRNRAVEAAQ